MGSKTFYGKSSGIPIGAGPGSGTGPRGSDQAAAAASVMDPKFKWVWSIKSLLKGKNP